MATYAELREKYVNGQGKEQQTQKREAPDNAKIVEAVRQYTAQHQAENAGKWAAWQEVATARDNASVAARAAEEAQKKYDEYLLTDEAQSYMRQNQAAKGAQMMQGTGISTPYAAGMQQQYKIEEDELEKQLRAKRDYYQQQAQQAETQRIMKEDLAEFEKWPEEDRLKLHTWIDYGGGSFNSLIGAVDGKLTADAYMAKKELEEKYGAETVDRMMRSVSRSENAQLMQDAAAEGQQMGADHAVLGSAATVPMNLIGAISAPLGYLSEAVRGGKGQYPTLDPNNLGNLPNAYSVAVRGQVAQNISGDEYDVLGNKIEDGGALRQGLAVGYQGLMSLADSYARALAGGGPVGGAVLAATGSFSQAVADASRMGATPGEAVLMGVATSGIEALAEKIPMDELFKVAKNGNTNMLRQLFKQASIEIGTEELSMFGTLMAEAAILREKSSYKQAIADAMAHGASYAEAKAQADKDIILEALETAAVAGTAGLLGGGVSTVVGNARNGNAQADVQTPAQTEVAAEAPAAPAEQAQQAEATTQPQQTETAAEAAQMPKERQAVQDAVDVLMGKEKPAQPKSQQQEQIDNATAAMLAENGVVQPEAEQKVVQKAAETSASEKIPDEMPTVIKNAIEARQYRENSKDSGYVEFTKEEIERVKNDAVAMNWLNERGLTPEQMDYAPRIKGTGAAEQNKSVGAMGSQFKHEVKKSKIYTNTYANTPYEDIYDVGRSAMKDDPNVQMYDAITEAESLNEAEQRTQTGQDRYVEFKHLMNKSGWTGADNDTAMKLLVKFREEGKADRVRELRRKQREMGTQSGQMVQSFAKYSREDATVAVLDAVDELDKMSIDQVDSRFWKETKTTKEKGNKFDSFEDWKNGVTSSLLGIANDIESVPDGDTDGMRDIVRQLANLRHTTAWAGYSSELTKRTEIGLSKMDFATLKGVAKTQIAMIPHDYQKRNAGEIIKAIRVQNMLFTLTTKFKNDTGNISNGFMDAVSDSYAGRMADYVISKFTGKRTVGNDIKYANEYVKAAKDASDVAAAFVSLDVPMETDAKYIKGTRTFSPNRENIFLRLLSAYEKHMKYALEVSDKFYEGGATHVVRKSIEDLGALSGLDEEQIQTVSKNVGQRRTFKDPGYKVDKDGQPTNRRALARANVGLQRALNNIGTEEIGAGDLFIPFAAVSGEVKQVGADYSGMGFASGLSEMINIVKDVRNGKEIDPYRQRSAATNFGRSLTGLGVTVAFAALAAAGAIKVHEAKENKERIKDQSQGLSGGQWNMDASLRWLQTYANTNSVEAANKAAGWGANDELVSFDFLEPFSTQMRMGYYLSQDQGVMQALIKGNMEALLDMPMMQTFSDLADLQQAFTEVSDGDMSGVYDAAGQLVGTVAGSVVPNWVRKANQVIDPYYRDTYSANPVEKAAKEVMAAIPGVSKTLPKKYDTMGNVQRRYEEGEELAAAVDTMVTPWDVDTYNANPVYQEIDRLNEALRDKKVNVTPTQPKRTVTYTDVNGDKHENEQLTGKQYETLTRVYGETNFKIVSALMENSNFQKLTDLEKAYTLDAVYEYAAEQGKKAALGKEYYSNADAWIGKVKDGDLNAFMLQGSKKVLNNVVDNVVTNFTQNWEVSEAAKDDLEASWQTFDKMSKSNQDKLLEAVTGDTVRYLLARQDNVSAESWMAVTDSIKSLKPEKGEDNVSASQEYAAIANAKNVSEKEKDALMRAYMPDYDPENGKTKQTEIKYDYMRQVMKLSPAKAVAALRISGESGKKDEKKKRWIKLGLSPAQADTLWNLLNSSSEKDKIDVVAWSNSKTK